MRRYFLLLACSSLVTLAVSAQAQQGGSAIGAASPITGAVLPGVTIIVTHQESGTVRETITGADGTFLVPGLVPGPYRITASSPASAGSCRRTWSCASARRSRSI